MDKEKVLKLFNDYIAQEQVTKQIEAKYARFKDADLEPTLPTICETLDTWINYQDVLQTWRDAKSAIECELHNARAALSAISEDLVQELPAQVWFKHSETAIGLAYTGYGPSHYYVVTEPWSDNLPSLSRDHHD